MPTVPCFLFRLGLNFFFQGDDSIEFYIDSENEQELNIKLQVLAQTQSGSYVEQKTGTKKFSKSDKAWAFMAFNMNNIADFLFQGHLVLRQFF